MKVNLAIYSMDSKNKIASFLHPLSHTHTHNEPNGWKASKNSKGRTQHSWNYCFGPYTWRLRRLLGLSGFLKKRKEKEKRLHSRSWL